MDKVEGVVKLNYPRLFSWDGSKFFGFIGLHDICDDTVIFHTRAKDAMAIFENELIYRGGSGGGGIIVLQGKCKNPAEFIEDQIIAKITNCRLWQRWQTGCNVGKRIFYFEVTCEIWWSIQFTKNPTIEWEMAENQ